MTLKDEILALGMSLDDHQAVADALSVGRVKVSYTEIGCGTVLSELGLTRGNMLLDIIYGSQDYRYVKPLLEQGRLDVGSALVRGTLDFLVAGAVITTAEAQKLKALAERPDPVPLQDVSHAINEIQGIPT